MRHKLNWAAILTVAIVGCAVLTGRAQIDPYHRNLLEFGYDQPLVGQGPQAIYLYYHYNNPDFTGTNTALRLDFAPAYFDGEIGFKHLISPTTDVGIGISGGAYGDSYYEVRQGHYYKEDSFDGYGGGSSLNLYQLLNPGMEIPINVVVRGGLHYSSYAKNCDTANNFSLPANLATSYIISGIRIAGKEPGLYPDLGLEVSAWFEREWRNGSGSYGYNDDRAVNAGTDLYWLYAGINYAWTNTGQHVSFDFTAGGSVNADRFSAYRIGGVLPLVAEYPLILPGYYYEELTATRFVNLAASYEFPLVPSHSLKFRLEAATASLSYLPGFEQSETWQSGVGGGLSFAPKSQHFRVILRYGYGIDALRNGREGSHSVGILFQYDFEHWRANRHHG